MMSDKTGLTVILADRSLRNEDLRVRELPDPLRSVLEDKGYEKVDILLLKACGRAGLLSSSGVRIDNPLIRYGQ